MKPTKQCLKCKDFFYVLQTIVEEDYSMNLCKECTSLYYLLARAQAIYLPSI